MVGRVAFGRFVRLTCPLFALANAVTCRTLTTSADKFLQAAWTTEQGLPQNSINAILQTADGYLWLGTFGGLARFDGVKFTIFDTANTPGMKSNRILSLCEGRNGTLWMGTDSGEVMSYQGRRAKTHTINDGLPGGIVWTVKEDSAGVLWVASLNGVARFQDGKFKTYTTRDGLPDNRVWSIEEDQAGHVWLASSGGLVRFDQGRFTTFQPAGGMPVDVLFVPLCVRRQGGFWTITGNGLACFKEDSFTLYPNAPRPPAFKAQTLMEDRGGTLWMSGFSPPIAGRFIDHRYSRYLLKTDNAVVRAMYQDRERNLWMGSDGGGLVELRPRRVTSYTTEDGLPSNNVHSILDDGTGGF